MGKEGFTRKRLRYLISTLRVGGRVCDDRERKKRDILFQDAKKGSIKKKRNSKNCPGFS